MRHSVTMLEADWQTLTDAIFGVPEVEGAAFLICGTSVTHTERRLLVRQVLPVQDEHYLLREPYRLSLDSPSYARAAKAAGADGSSILFVHSHPYGQAWFSPQDDREDPKLHAFFADRLPNGPHGSLVVARDGEASSTRVLGRMWVDGEWIAVDRVRVVGNEFRLYDNGGADDLPVFFDRQVRAFGPEIQRILQRLHVGVVGAGGTGSAVIEQLTRLGVGRITPFDGDNFDPTNVNRVYGSRATDEGNKANIADRSVGAIGLPTKLQPVPRYIDEEDAAKLLRECDVIFGCTDDHTSRSILVRIAWRYLIPVFDMGVVIDSDSGRIRDVTGRVTLLMPGEACLFCRGRISPERIAFEALTEAEQQQRIRDGYGRDVGRAPAVIPFTTAVAAQAVSELLHRLTGFMGPTAPSEVLLRLDSREIRGNRTPPTNGCSCTLRERWGRGDEEPFLGRGWRPPRP